MRRVSGGVVMSVVGACLVSCSSTPPSGIEDALQSLPTASPTEQRARCQQVSDAFYDEPKKAGFVPSSALVPAPLARHGFGVPDAQCSADPELGIYYQVLVWSGRVEHSRIAAFERSLVAARFHRDRSEPEVRSYDAPAGIRDQIDGRYGELRTVIVAEPTESDPSTSIIWI